MSSSAASHPKTFAELFCEQHHVALGDFERTVVQSTLHPQAKFLRHLLQLAPGEYFAADFEFVRNVGHLTRMSDFAWEVSDFHAHPANRRTLRRRLKVRLSIKRLRNLVARTLPAEPLLSPSLPQGQPLSTSQ